MAWPGSELMTSFWERFKAGMLELNSWNFEDICLRGIERVFSRRIWRKWRSWTNFREIWALKKMEMWFILWREAKKITQKAETKKQTQNKNNSCMYRRLLLWVRLYALCWDVEAKQPWVVIKGTWKRWIDECRHPCLVPKLWWESKEGVLRYTGF